MAGNDQGQLSLVSLPIEVLVYIFSLISSTRDKVKLRYVSQRVRTAVETPSLWEDFTWLYFDFREGRSIKSLFESCGGYVKRLSFPGAKVIHVKSLRHCSNVLRLSLPSVRLSVNQLRTILQSMKKLQYLDVLWVSKSDVKWLLLMLGYPVYGRTIKELTIREQVSNSKGFKALVFLLNVWTAVMLAPSTLNVVSNFTSIGDVLVQWIKSKVKNCVPLSVPQAAHHIGHLNFYTVFNVSIGLFPTSPIVHAEISLLPSANISFVIAKNCGLSRSEEGCILLSERNIGNGYILFKGDMIESKGDDICGTPMNINNIEFLTSFSAFDYRLLCSEHLERLAVACPNLQQLNLKGNVDCLKCLQGLRTIAIHCRKLEGLNISNIMQLESCLRLWEILVDIQLLTYLAIQPCFLLGSEQDNQTITSLHEKCVKLKSLEACTYTESLALADPVTEQPLLLSNFPSLIHFLTDSITNVIVPDGLKYLRYFGYRHSWDISNYNLEQVCIRAHLLDLSDSFMASFSAHGGLVHVSLFVNRVTQTGIESLIGNSPNLITCQIYGGSFSMSISDFRTSLMMKYGRRKLFVCGSLTFTSKGYYDDLCDFILLYNMEVVSLWSDN